MSSSANQTTYDHQSSSSLSNELGKNSQHNELGSDEHHSYSSSSPSPITSSHRRLPRTSPPLSKKAKKLKAANGQTGYKDKGSRSRTHADFYMVCKEQYEREEEKERLKILEEHRYFEHALREQLRPVDNARRLYSHRRLHGMPPPPPLSREAKPMNGQTEHQDKGDRPGTYINVYTVRKVRHDSEDGKKKQKMQEDHLRFEHDQHEQLRPLDNARRLQMMENIEKFRRNEQEPQLNRCIYASSRSSLLHPSDVVHRQLPCKHKSCRQKHNGYEVYLMENNKVDAFLKRVLAEYDSRRR